MIRLRPDNPNTPALYGADNRWKSAGRPYTVAQLAGYEGGAILDIGAGDLSALALLPPGGPLKVGLDFSAPRMAAMRALYHGIRWVAADAHALPFRAGAFPFVTIGRVLELLEDPLVAVSEARRVLAPGGVLTVVLAGPSVNYANAVWRFDAEIDAPAVLNGLGRRLLTPVPGGYTLISGRKPT